MKKSKLKNIIRESINKLMNEAAGRKQYDLRSCSVNGSHQNVCLAGVRVGDMINIDPNPNLSNANPHNYFIRELNGPCTSLQPTIPVNYMPTECSNCCGSGPGTSWHWGGNTPQGACTNPTINSACDQGPCKKCCCEDDGQGGCLPNTEMYLNLDTTPCQCPAGMISGCNDPKPMTGPTPQSKIVGTDKEIQKLREAEENIKYDPVFGNFQGLDGKINFNQLQSGIDNEDPKAIAVLSKIESSGKWSKYLKKTPKGKKIDYSKENTLDEGMFCCWRNGGCCFNEFYPGGGQKGNFEGDYTGGGIMWDSCCGGSNAPKSCCGGVYNIF